jgi:nicotinamidase-related amidase
MPLSTLDQRPALIMIDMQKGILQMPAAHPVIKIVQRAASLAEAFRRRQLPVVLVTVTGAPPGRTDVPQGNFTPPPDWADLAGGLGAHPGDHTITKQCWGAFTGTSLHDHLQSRGATQVVLTGIATSIGVESSARCAHEYGYYVVLATDAMTDLDPDAHRHSVEKIFPRLGETATTSEIIAMLDIRQPHPPQSLR